MAMLYGSKRTSERATYTPIKIDERSAGRDGRAWDKWSYLSALAPSAVEMRQVVRQLESGGEALTERDREHLHALAALVEAEGDVPRASLPMEAAAALGRMPAAMLQRVGRSLVRVRTETLQGAIAAQQELVATYAQKAARDTAPAAEGTSIPAGFRIDPAFTAANLPGAAVYRRSETQAAGDDDADETRLRLESRAGELRSPETARSRRPLTTMMTREAAVLARPAPLQTRAIAAVSPASQPLDAVMRAAAASGISVEAAQKALDSLGPMKTLSGTMSAGAFATFVEAAITGMNDLVDYFTYRVQMEPIGLLHLERLNFIPAGIERGELVSSVPLSPNEEVNITHKEWSNTSEEFERIVTDYLEAYSEEGVVEKSEFSQSTSSQTQHSSGFNMSVTASGGFGPVSVSTAMGYNVAESASASEQLARQHSSEVTRKAAARTRKEHKVSFKVASASGTEDQAVRKIKNTFPDKATRVDFYQLVRKWQVDLYRYGVRLTYDVTIPEPGSDVLSKIVEMNGLRAALQEPFDTPASTQPWAKFTYTPADIDRLNYTTLAADYGVTIETPPVESFPIVRSFSGNWAEDEIEYGRVISFEVEVPHEYEVTAWGTTGMSSHFSGDPWNADVKTDLNTWFGASGRLTLSVYVKNLAAYNLELGLTLGLKAWVYEGWQMRAWSALRAAAQARYEAQRALIKERLARLQEELGAQDPLSLRKIEREEVMKGVLRWLFGPTFAFVPPGLGTTLYAADQAVESTWTWNRVLAKGETIKFLHHAIEWENMTYFLYPYFWSHTARWELKKYLDHPDFLHRAFLKSGAARVVLTIRPGFETAFVNFVETGGGSSLPPSHPYLTIAQEIEAHAKTNYPGIRAANPVEAARPLLTPLQRKAWREMERIVTALEKFRVDKGRYPETGEGLAALTGIISVPAADPWGHPYQYLGPGKVTDFELWSMGADGAAGGSDEDADITSWAEASLIGRWFDYTPTSALDIAYNEVLPSA